ncbi:MAG: lipopolysaccharide heptosyltransferase II [Planctomycetes bacterium]|nr:lipopolysaccharide heptosyltransferase II [Planctomycetota bacterium]
MEPFERILVRAPNPLGDAVMATPLLRCLRRSWPRARITVLAMPSGAEAYRGLETVDRVEVYRRHGGDAGPGGFLRVARRLRAERFDLALLCPNSHSSALLALLAGARRRVGWSYNGRGPLLTDALRPEKAGFAKRVARPMTSYYLDLARHLGAEVTDERTELRTTPDGEEEALRALAAGGWREGEPLAALAVGASFGPSKLWTAEGFARTGDALAAKGLRVAVLHGPGEEPVARAVQERMGTSPVVGAGTVLGLAGLKSLSARLSVIVTTDTGPRHVASAFGVPAVVVMGPTDPVFTNCNLERTVVLRKEVDCTPYRWPCHEKACPLENARFHQCMTRIPFERAVAAAEDLMGRFPRGS